MAIIYGHNHLKNTTFTIESMNTIRAYPIYHRETYQIALQYPYIQGSAVDEKVRGLSGRKYSKSKGCWYIPYRDDYKKYSLYSKYRLI